MLTTSYTVMKEETETCMRLLGVETVEQLGPQHVSYTAMRRFLRV